MKLVRAIWRFLVGVKDALVLLAMLLFFGALYAALSMSPNPAVADGGALLLDLDGAIVEQPAEAQPLDLLSAGGTPRVGEYRLRDLVRALDRAAGDARVKAVVLDLDGFTGGGQAAITTVGGALDRVRARKPVLAFATAYSDDGYQLAAHASEVWLDPLGQLLVTGPGGSQLYYKGLLDRLGVTAHIYRVGTYKSAVEPFLRSDQSPEARAANQQLVNALWGTWQADIARARPQARIAPYLAAITRPNGSFAEVARAQGLVDRLGDRAAFGNRVAALVGPSTRKVPGDFRTIALDAWTRAVPERSDGEAIGVVTVAGNIVDGFSPPGTAGAEGIADELLEAIATKKLKALVVRIDSPGGSVTGSDRIRSAVLQAKARGIPVVASMGSVAASGGYWIATAADRIYAEPATVTGSIGVFALLPTFEGALAKVGLSADGVGATPYSGQPDVLRGTTPAIDAVMQAAVEQLYARFLGIVAQARHLPVQRVDQIAQGRVWDGASARRLGLVDGFGGLDAAIAEAARRARLDPAKVRPVFIEREPSLALRLLRDAIGSGRGEPRHDALGRLATRPVELAARAAADVRAMLDGPAVQARCLECPPVAPAPPLSAGSLVALLQPRP